jgi:hypothetical protein
MEFVIDQVGHRALSASTQSGEPNDTPLVTVELLPFFTGDGMFVPMNLYFGILSHRRVFFP